MATQITTDHGAGSYIRNTEPDNTKTGFKLAADGLDAIPTTAPAGDSPTYPQMQVRNYRRFHAPAVHDPDAETVTLFADDGTTPLLVQPLAVDSDGIETQGSAVAP